MIEVEIPGERALRLEHLVLDFNGTLACDGILLAGVRDRLIRLSGSLRIHVVTGDTFHRARAELAGLPCDLHILGPLEQARAKLNYVQQLGTERTACVGNGRNDVLMVEAAALGIAVVQAETAAAATVRAADLVARDVCDALDLFFNPQRLVAALRA